MTDRTKWLEELATACWRKLHPESPESPRIPTADQLLTDIDAEYMAVARQEYRTHFNQATILAYPELTGVLDSEVSIGEAELPSTHDLDEIATNVDLEAIHTIWKTAREISDEEPPKHPVAPLIAAWQSRTEPESRNTGIYPGSFSIARTSALPLWADLDIQAGETPPSALAPTTAYLPGLQPAQPQLAAYPALREYDPNTGELKAYRRTRGNTPAPMQERLFLEMILSVKREDRARSIHHEITVRDLRDWMYPNGWARGRNWPMIYEALRELPLAGFEIGDGFFFPIQGLVWLPRGIPTLDSKVVIAMSFPDQSASGPLMFRPATQALGLKSDALWRTFVQLQAQWSAGAYPSHKRGRQRIPSGYVRADSEARVRYRVFIPDELVRMWHGAELPQNLNPNTLRSMRQRARDAFDTLEELGLCQIEKDVTDREGRKGWRIMPPTGWGPNFDIDMREGLRRIRSRSR